MCRTCSKDEHADMLFAFSPDTGKRCSGILDVVCLLSIAECKEKLTKLFNTLHFACETKQIDVIHVFGVDNSNIKSIYESLIVMDSIQQDKADIADGKMQVRDLDEINTKMQIKLHDAFSNVLCNIGNLEHSSINPKEFIAYLYKTSGNMFVSPELAQALYEQTALPLCQPAMAEETPAALRIPTREEALQLAGGWCARDPENKALCVGLALMQGRKTHREIYIDVMGKGKNVNGSQDTIKRAIQYRADTFLKVAQEKGYDLRQYVKR